MLGHCVLCGRQKIKCSVVYAWTYLSMLAINSLKITNHTRLHVFELQLIIFVIWFSLVCIGAHAVFLKYFLIKYYINNNLNRVRMQLMENRDIDILKILQ